MDKTGKTTNNTTRMKNGLVIGKFMPFHIGHIVMIDFSLKHTDALTVAVLCQQK